MPRLVSVLLLCCTAPLVRALRVPWSTTAQSVSRRDALLGAAAAAVLQSAPAAAEVVAPTASTLLGVVKELELNTPKESRNQVSPTAHTPILISKSAGVALTTVDFSVEAPGEYIQIMWLKKFAPNAAPGYIDVVTVKRFAAGEAPLLSKTLPKGAKLVPMHFSTKDGLWEGQPFVVP